MDYFTKLFKYRASGIREYWIVDPDRERIVVYDFESEDTQEYAFSESVKSSLDIPGIPAARPCEIVLSKI